MKRLSIFLFGLILSGCITLHTPQSRNEFITTLVKDDGALAMHKFTVTRNFNSVVKSIHRKSKSCLSMKVTNTLTHGFTRSFTSVSVYSPSMRYISKRKAEFTLQVEITPNNVSKPPPGGMYFVAANISKKSKNKTSVIIYAPPGSADNIVASIKKWSMGKNSKCPKL